MSSETYNKLWDEARNIISEAARIDTLLQKAAPQQDKQPFHEAVCEAYYKYILACNMLQECYDQIVQPQKRLLLRKVLDACLGRVLELKADLENTDLSEHSYNDDVLYKIKVSPIDAQLKVPKYFRNERLDDIKYKRDFIDSVLKKLGLDEKEEKKIVLTEIEAIQIIQKHERARQGRLRCIFMREIRKVKDPTKQEKTEEMTFVSALMIQKMWRGFVERRKIRKLKVEEMVLIGMIPPMPKETDLLERLERMQADKRRVQAEHEEKFIKIMEEVETKLREKKGVLIMEQITDEIRQMFRDYFTLNRSFPEFPSDEDGGSKAMMAEVAEDIASGRSSKSSGKKPAKKEKKEKDKKGKGDKKEEKRDLGYKVAETLLLPEIVAGDVEYEEVWKYKDERNNPQQVHDDDIVYREKYSLIEQEVRLVADEMMRAELDLLQEALDKDKGQKSKKKKGKKKGRGKGKKKKEKDLTPDRTTESLFEELITNGIIKRYPETDIDSYIGEMSYAAYDFRRKEKNIMPCLGDIRQLVKQYCIIPMGSDTLHQMLPLTKSILISGPAGSGKKMLVYAICTAIGAVLFDLSPSTIEGKYPDKEGLIMLMHLISKMSKLLQPSVIWMDEAEAPFIKKMPKGETRDLKRLKKDFPKFIKSMTIEDRVVVIGTSRVPWDADKALLTSYQKYIMIPRPDFGTISYVYKDYLRQFSAIGPLFDVTCIAKLSDGYTVGEILKTLKSVITTKRMLQLRVVPLTPKEILVALSKNEPVFKEEDEAAEQFWWKTTVGRLRAAVEAEQNSKKKNK